MPFSDAPWTTPAGDLSPEEYCQVCLIDLNPPGKEKLKKNCKLPTKYRPGAPHNRNALRNIMSRIFQMTDVPTDERRTAARHLVRLANEAGINVGASVLRLAGMKVKK